MNLILSWLLVLISSVSFADEYQKVTVIADYSNIISSMSDDPHQSGYAVAIYKREDGFLFGHFTFATGSTEGIGAKLFDLHFDGKYLAFKAKTSAYEIVNLRHVRPSRELFEFNGKIHGKRLIGTLTVWDGYNLSKPQSVQKMIFNRIKIATPLSYEVYQSFFEKDPW